LSNSSAAQRSTHPGELDWVATVDGPAPHLPPAVADIANPEDPALPPFALRQQVAERLAAHRARPVRSTADPAAPAETTPRPSRSRSAHIAAAVAERYAQSPSYRTFLAAEAERSVRHAEAAVDVANINAKAIAVAQQQLLVDLEHWDPDPEDFALGPIPVPSTAYTPLPTPAEIASAQAHTHEQRHQTETLGAESPQPESSQPESSQHRAANVLPLGRGPLPIEPSTFTVRHYDIAPAPSFPERLTASPAPHPDNTSDDPEGFLLDEEIAFRHDPTFDEPAGNPLALTANLLEFPRQLIAARKARPRLAEGPLRDDTHAEDSTHQLRIFEVESDQISADPALSTDLPEWFSILLAAHPHTDPEPNSDPQFIPDSRPHTAPISLRLISALVDSAILLGSLAAFAGIAVLTVTHLSGNTAPAHIPWPIAAAALAATLILLTVAYSLLFFTFSDATPGMRYARIALCTLTDKNPTRSAMRRRLLFTLFAALPLGLGLLWAFLDEDSLGWHDRLSGIYQRSY